MDALFVNEKGGENRPVRLGFESQNKCPSMGALKRADRPWSQPFGGYKRAVFRQFFKNITKECSAIRFGNAGQVGIL